MKKTIKKGNHQSKEKKSSRELLQCTVCWGEGKIEIDDYGNEEDCTYCRGTGIIRKNI